MRNDIIDSEIDAILAEDDRRMALMYADYNPVTGEGAVASNTRGEQIIFREKVVIPDCTLPIQWITPEMKSNELIAAILQHGSLRTYAQKVLGD